MSVFDICYNNVYKIKRQQSLYNFAPYRYDPKSPYPNYTEEQLSMRRKQEILNFTSNSQNSKTGILSKLTNSPSNRLSTTLTQNIDVNVPLYNYINDSNAYGTTLKTTTNMWNIIKDDNVVFVNNTVNKLFRIQILDNIDKPKSNITYQTQVAIYISGTGVNNLITSSNYGYSIQLAVDNINVDIKYNDISTGINGYLTYNFSSINSFSCSLPSFSNYVYLGMLTVTIPELPTVVGYIYDVYLTFNCKVTPNLDNFFNDFSYKVNNYCNLTQGFSLPSTVSYYIVNEITSSKIISIPSYINQIYYVLVGGGGGGNYGTGGGGGGGGGIVSGFINQSNSTDYTVIVGSGGRGNINGKGSSIQGSGNILNWATAAQGLSNPTGIAISNGYLYAANQNTNKISKISLINPTGDYNINWATSTQGLISSLGIATDNSYIYVSNSNNTISRISLTNPDTSYNTNWATSTQGLSSPSGLTITNGYLYVANYNADSISKISLTNPTTDFSANWATSTQNVYFPNAIITDSIYVYVITNNPDPFTLDPSYNITRINLVDPSIYNASWATPTQGLNYPSGLTITNGYLYVLNSYTISQISLTDPNYDFNPYWEKNQGGNHLAITTDDTFLYTSYGFSGVGSNFINVSKLATIAQCGFCPVTPNYEIGGISGGTNKSLYNVTGVTETGNSTNGGNVGTNVTDIGGYSINIITSANNYFTRYYGGGGGGNYQEAKKNSLYGGASAGINNIGYSNIVSGTPNSGGGGGGQVNFTDASSVIINTNTDVQALLIYNNQLYVSNFNNSNYGNSSSVYRVNLSNPDISYNLTQGMNHPFGLASDGTYLYVSNFNYLSTGLQSISRISLTNPDTSYNASWATSTQLLGFVQGMVVDISGGYLYAANYYTYTISKISLTNPNGDYDKYWATSYATPQSQNQGNQIPPPIQPNYLAIDNYGYLYVSCGFYICKISLTNPKNDFYSNWAGNTNLSDNIQGINIAMGLVIFNDYLYVANSVNSTISKISLFYPTVDYNAFWATSIQGLNSPSGLATDGTYIYAANTGNNLITGIPLKTSGGSGSVVLFFNASFTTGILYDNYIVGGNTVNTNTDSLFLNFNNSFFNQQYYYYDGTNNFWTNLVFYTNGTVKITNMPIGKSVYLLVVGGGGGGGGGSNGGGGGGGGGVVQTQIYPTIGDIFTVTIGSGGTGGCADLAINSTNGGNTTVTSSISDINITAYGGGAAGQTGIGMTGASSGGNARNTNLGSAPVKIPNAMHIGFGKYMYSLQGCVAGSTINTYSNSGSSGGGGAGTAGGNGSNNTSGTSSGEISGFGGIGLQYSLNGIRKDYFWGGGGGGASSNPSTGIYYDPVNNGGNGGGGGGSGIKGGAGGGNAFHYGGTGAGGIAGNGATNTGGGGGGNVGLNTYGGNGGSGIVIIAIQQ